MAFSKAIQNPFTGVTATYWRLVAIKFDALNARATLVLAGYMTRQYRDQPDGRPVDHREFLVDQASFAQLAGAPANAPTVFGVIATAAYGYIKAAGRIVPGQPEPLPSEFADAEDV